MGLTTEECLTMPTDNPVVSKLDLGGPPDELVEYAKRELGEDLETRCQVLSEFKDLIYERGECLPHRMDDAFLLRFLRAKYFVIRHAHRMLVSYYDFKENNPEFFEDVNLNKLEKFGETNLISVPPYREQTGRRILLYRMGLWDPEKYSIAEVFQATMLILELAILEQRAQILGGVCIFDLGGITMQQIWYMTPTIAKQIFEIMAVCFPMRIHSVHIINQPWLFDVIINFFKPFMTEAMNEKIFIHGDDMESLHQHIDPKYLPERYGGIHVDYNYNDWMTFFRESEQIRWELTSLGYYIKKDADSNTEEDED